MITTSLMCVTLSDSYIMANYRHKSQDENNTKKVRNHMKSVALHNLGCKVNAYEMEVMQQKLQDQGYKIVPF